MAGEEKISYVLAVACDEMIAVAGRPAACPMSWQSRAGGAWRRLRRRVQGLRGYNMTGRSLRPPGADHWLLARRSLHPGEKATSSWLFPVLFAPAGDAASWWPSQAPGGR